MVRKMPKVCVETKRTILYENNDVSVVCFQWKKYNGLPEHDHYGKCLFQVVDGKLLEKRKGNIIIMNPDDQGSIDKGITHSIQPLEDSKSLHIYSPPPPCLKNDNE